MLFKTIITTFLIYATLILTACGGGGSSESSETTTTAIIDRFDFVVTVEKSSLLSDDLTSAIGEVISGPLASRLNKEFSLPDRNVNIALRDCGEDNAFYDPNSSEVIMCWDILRDMIWWGDGFFEDSEDLADFALGAYPIALR